MKTIFYILSIFLFPIAVSGQHQDMTNAANYKKYAEANLSESKRVVFIGNSITEGWVSSSPAFFTDNNYIGRGISGQTSSQLLLRFRQDVINLKPVAVVINIGTNDIAQNTGEYVPQFTMDCIQSMAELASYNGIKVILASVLPAGEFGWRKEIKDVSQKIDALNTLIRTYAETNGFAYIDYNTEMRDENGALKKDYGRDTVHPNKEGYNVMGKIAKEVIDKVVMF
jgi:lysophospholipase L1-like esterase